MIVGGSRELLSQELEEQKAKTQKLEGERNKKAAELEASKKKVNDLKQWLHTLLTMAESQLDIIPQVRTGLAEIESLRESNYELRKRLFAERRRTDSLKQDYFKVKKKAKEQQITLNDVDKGVLILEKEALAEKIDSLSTEVDKLSAKNVEYTRMTKMSDHELNAQYEEAVKYLMKLKSEHLNLLNSLAFYADPPFPHAGGEIRPRGTKEAKCRFGCGGGNAVEENKETELDVNSVTLTELQQFNSNLLEADNEATHSGIE